MPTYLCQLGRETELSSAEFSAVLAEHQIEVISKKIHKTLLIVETKQECDIPSLMKQLGGTILIAKEHPFAATADSIADLLESITSVGKIHFSLHASKRATQLALAIKKELKSRGRSVRYVAPKNTATIIHNNLDNGKGDLHIYEGNVFLTEAVQDIEGFSFRDYERPCTDSKSGMLPPKLSRIMINLAGGKNITSLHDPFCGSGTLLMEAMDLGIPKLSGSDLSPKAIHDSEKNLEWLIKQDETYTSHFSVMQADASVLSSVVLPGSISAIATEPYMGKPLKGNESLSTLQKQAKDLQELYNATLHEMHKVLRTTGTIVMIFPSFRWKNTWIPTVPEDALQTVFSVKEYEGRRFLRYHRPDQHLARDIWTFTKS